MNYCIPSRHYLRLLRLQHDCSAVCLLSSIPVPGHWWFILRDVRACCTFHSPLDFFPLKSECKGLPEYLGLILYWNDMPVLSHWEVGLYPSDTTAEKLTFWLLIVNFCLSRQCREHFWQLSDWYISLIINLLKFFSKCVRKKEKI